MAGLATSPPYTLDVRRKRDDVPGSVDEERQALFEQRRALEALKEQLAERVVAVQEREAELRSVLATARSGGAAELDFALPSAPAQDDARARELAARERSLDQLAATLAAREAELARRSAAADDPLARSGEELEHRSAALDQRAAELDRREAELRARAAAALPAAPGADLDARLDELRAAEKAFMRTREELAAARRGGHGPRAPRRRAGAGAARVHRASGGRGRQRARGAPPPTRDAARHPRRRAAGLQRRLPTTRAGGDARESVVTRLAAIALAVLTLGGAAQAASVSPDPGDPSRMVVQLGDLPPGFTTASRRARPNATVARETGVPLATLVDWGRIGGFQAEYGRSVDPGSPPRGAATVSAAASTYRTAKGLVKAYRASTERIARTRTPRYVSRALPARPGGRGAAVGDPIRTGRRHGRALHRRLAHCGHPLQRRGGRRRRSPERRRRACDRAQAGRSCPGCLETRGARTDRVAASDSLYTSERPGR